VFEDSLRRVLDAVAGARTVMVVDRDGMVISAIGEHTGDALELIAASYMDLARRAAEAGREVGIDPPREVTLSGPAGSVVIRSMVEGYGLLAVLRPDALVGHARFELRKLEARVGPELEV
jgi:predicted regulator of Ras-like GTPase activity (Roadblock/LC7/MglB family)